MADKQTNQAYTEAFGGNPASHDELVAPFDDIKEEDFFEQQKKADDNASFDPDDPDREVSDDEREYIPMPSIFEPIPEEAQKEILSNFALKKREKEGTIAITAQRLVNQFRALSAFRDDYVVTYNKELMEASNDVLAYMPTIIGGPAVREYLDYLLAQRQQGKEFNNETIDLDAAHQQQVGWLPSPDEEDTPSVAPLISTDSSVVATPSANPSALKKQTDMMAKALQEMTSASQKQAEMLNETILILKNSLEKGIPAVTTPAVSATSEGTPLDTVALLSEQRQMMESALNKMVEMQSSLFTKTVDELSKNVTEMREQLRPTGAVRQAMSALKASSLKKETPPTPPVKEPVKEKVKEEVSQPLFDQLDMAVQQVSKTVKKTAKAEKTVKEKENNQKTASTVALDDGEYEILTEFDIQEEQ